MQGPIDDPIPVSSTGPIQGGGGRRRWWQRFTDPEPEVAEPDAEPAPAPAPAPAPEERHDIVQYDLNGWTTVQRQEIDEQLTLSHVPHEWTRGVLSVPGAHEALADELVDVLDEADDLAFPGRVEAEVEYELPAWTPQQRDELVVRLHEAGIPFGWDGVTLGVRAADEAEVDAVVAAIDPGFPLGT